MQQYKGGKHMNNSIIAYYSGEYKATITVKAKNLLSSLKPKGCPFDGYSYLDLLADFISMYSWKITKNVPIKIVDFIAMLQEEKYSKALVYGNDIINILNTEV